MSDNTDARQTAIIELKQRIQSLHSKAKMHAEEAEHLDLSAKAADAARRHDLDLIAEYEEILRATVRNTGYVL